MQQLSLAPVTQLRGDAPRAILRQIAEIHVDQLHVGAMAACGTGFVESFYRHAARDPAAILIVRTDGERVIGFALSAVRPSAVYARIVPRLAARIAWQVISKPHLLVRLASIGSYVSGKSDGRPSGPELLSIAVAPDRQGEGIGASLLDEMRSRLSEAGAPQFVVTASDTQADAMRFYSRHGGVVLSETDLGGLRSYTYAMPPPARPH